MKRKAYAFLLIAVMSMTGIVGCGNKTEVYPVEEKPVVTESIQDTNASASNSEDKTDALVEDADKTEESNVNTDSADGKSEDTAGQLGESTASTDESNEGRTDNADDMGTFFVGPENDYMVLYGSVFNTIYKEIEDLNYNYSGNDGYRWLSDIFLLTTPREIFKNIGYTIRDLNGDLEPELVITNNTGEEIYALYSLVEGKPYLVAEGWSRNTLKYMGGGSFYNDGSNGAMYSIFAQYDFPVDKAELVVKDFYFTFEKDENFNLGYYYNNTGVYDKSLSKEISMEEFNAAWEDLASFAVPLEVTLFSDTMLHVDHASDLQDFNNVSFYEASKEDYSSQIVFWCDEDIADIKLITIDVQIFESGDETVFEELVGKELHDYGALKNGDAVVAQVMFGETLPVVGVQITERNGSVRNFAVDISGEDSSVYMWEF